MAAAPPGARWRDPACGGGALLVAIARAGWSRAACASPAERVAWMRAHLRGTDTDPDAVAWARAALATAAGAPGADLADVVGVDDGLAPFRADVVVTNPPWVTSARMDPARRAALARRFACARGNWDLAVPFVAHAVASVGDAGTVVALVPDRMVAAPYARALRTEVGPRTRAVVDARDVPLDAEVGGAVWVLHAGSGPCDRGPGRTPVDLPEDGAPWPVFADDDDLAWLDALRHAPTIGQVADVVGAATVAEAYAWAEVLTEGTPSNTHHPLVNSGTLDPFAARWGQRPMRYLGASWQQPVVPLDAIAPRRAALARAPKVIVAGMTKVLEALPDPDGRWLAAKSTVAVRTEDPDLALRLGAWLAHPVATAVHRARAGGLGFRGGYLRVGVPEVRGLPVPEAILDDTTLDAPARARLADPDDVDVQRALDDLVTARLDTVRPVRTPSTGGPTRAGGKGRRTP